MTDLVIKAQLKDPDVRALFADPEYSDMIAGLYHEFAEGAQRAGMEAVLRQEGVISMLQRFDILRTPMNQEVVVDMLNDARLRTIARARFDECLLRLAHLRARTGGDDVKADQPTGAFTSTTQYAGIVYGKAPLLFDAQRKLVGEDGWEKALKAYVEQHRYRWVTSKTLTEVASKLAPGKARGLEALRRRWLEETHGDEDVGTRGRGLLDGARPDASVDLHPDVGVGRIGDPARLTDLGKHVVHEGLAAEARLHRHHQDHVDVADDLADGVDRGAGLEGDAHPRTRRADVPGHAHG